MQSVSADFITAALATTRKPKARVTITWTDPYLDLSIVASANEENRVNYPKQTADLSESMTYKWLHLDGTTQLSNAMHPMPSTEALARNYQVGWWGSSVADALGNYSLPYPALTIEFSPRPVLEIVVVGDDKFNEYPVDFTVQIYNGAVLLHTDNVVGNAAVKYTKDVTAQDITEATKMILTISKWSTGSRVVKIAEFFSSIVEVYDGDTIVSMNILEEMELTDGSLPIGNISSNEMDLELENINDEFFPGNTASTLHTLIKRNRKIEPELGFQLPDDSIEYVPMGVFWSDDWATPELGNTARTSARDRMELLRKSVFSTSLIYENTTLYALAGVVLADAQIQMPDMQYSIDTELQNYTIAYAWLPRQSHMKALREIAEAALGRVYCDRTGVVVVAGPSAIGGYSVKSISQDNYFQRNQPSKSEEIANIIEVKTNPLIPATADAEVFVSQEPTASIPAGNTISVDIQYSDPPVKDASAKAYIPNAQGGLDGTWPAYTNQELTITTDTVYYAWGATVYIKNETASAEQAIIVIAGKPLTIQGQEVVSDSDQDSIDIYGELKYEFPDNILVQDRATAELIVSTLLTSYADNRRDAMLDWRGDPSLELADVVTVPEFVKGALDITGSFAIIRQQFRYDGALRARLEGRKVPTLTTTTTTAAP